MDRKNGRILEYGAILYDMDGTKLRTTDYLIKSDRPIPPKLTEIHGIDAAMLADKPYFKEVALLIKEELLAPNQVLMGHNVMFDLEFLYWSLKRVGIDLEPYELQYICTKNMSKTLCSLGLFDNKGSNRLEHLALEVFGVPDPGHHRSINDDLVCMGVYSKMMDLIYK